LRGAEFDSARGGEVEILKLFERTARADGERGTFENGREAELVEQFYFEGKKEGRFEGRSGDFVEERFEQGENFGDGGFFFGGAFDATTGAGDLFQDGEIFPQLGTCGAEINFTQSVERRFAGSLKGEIGFVVEIEFADEG
jgi:hypothetical protein